MGRKFQRHGLWDCVNAGVLIGFSFLIARMHRTWRSGGHIFSIFILGVREYHFPSQSEHCGILLVFFIFAGGQASFYGDGRHHGF